MVGCRLAHCEGIPLLWNVWLWSLFSAVLRTFGFDVYSVCSTLPLCILHWFFDTEECNLLRISWFLVNDQRDAQFFTMYLFLFLTLHISSTSCSSSGERNCVNTTSSNCHSVSVAVSCAGRKFSSHSSYLSAYEDGTDRVFWNVGI
jgi:hypothetical protein